MSRIFCLLALFIGLAGPGGAVQPDEVLADPVLEARAREISAGLRCVMCRNESIDESNAAIARDLRLLVRERLVAGDTNQEVVDYIVARYGEFVLLRPNTQGSNLILWLAAPVLLLLALVTAYLTLRRRAVAHAPDTPLSAAEKARLDALLDE